MKIEDLLIYESPTISERLDYKWMQDIMSKYLAWKVNRKWKRYQRRIKTAELVRNMLNKTTP